MQQKAVNFLIRLLLTSLFSGACSTPTTPAPIAPPTETEIPLPAPPTATPTDLTLPTMYVEPEVPIPIADPSAPLKLGGPWWMIVTNEGIWVMNADGSGLQEIKPEVPLDYLVTNKIDVAPSGGRIVFLAGTNLDTGLQLQLLTIPQNEFQTIATLIEPGIEFTPFDEPGSVGFEAMQAVMAINYLESYAWSPDGSLLGFMGMIAGPSSDLYTYDPESGEINQLTDGPSHGYRVSWSPDGKYILHAGVSGFGTGAGYSMAGVWAARADGSGVKEINLQNLQGDFLIHGWTSNTTFVSSCFNALCGENSIRSVNIETGEQTVLWPGGYYQFAWDPDSGALLVAINKYSVDDPQCNPSGLSGIVYVDPDTGEIKSLLDGEPKAMRFSSPAQRFFVKMDEIDEIYEISVQGEVVRTIPAFPAVSPDGNVWAFFMTREGQTELYAGSPTTIPLISSDTAISSAAIVWDRMGERLIYADNGSLYIAQKPDFIPILVAESLPGLSSIYGKFAYWIEY
jgi:WD40 repeat protein